MERAIEIGERFNVFRDSFKSDLAFLNKIMDRLEGQESFKYEMHFLMSLYISLCK